MNAQILRTLVNRHAPAQVKEQIAALEALEHSKKALNKQIREIEFSLDTGGCHHDCPHCGGSGKRFRPTASGEPHTYVLDDPKVAVAVS